MQKELTEFFLKENYYKLSDNSFRLNHFYSKDQPYDLISIINDKYLTIYIRIFDRKYNEIYEYGKYSIKEMKNILKDKIINIVIEYIDELNK